MSTPEASLSTHALAQREHVTAILVSHGRDKKFLPETYQALTAQKYLPDRVLINAPADISLNTDHHPFAELTRTTLTGNNLGDIVRAALIEKPEFFPDGGWLWLVHADSAPEPEALDELLRAGEGSTKIAVVGPKQVGWHLEGGNRELLEVGIRATRTSRRVPEISPGERDQGQLDAREDVLAVGTAGSLVRTSVWRELNGFHPDLGPFGDGLEFSKRARLAGYRVVVQPRAIVRHARVRLGNPPRKSFGMRRRAEVLTAITYAPAWRAFLMWLGAPLLGIVRGLGKLLSKDVVRARGELTGALGIFLNPRGISRGRQAVTSTPQTRAGLRQLEAENREIRAARREERRSAADARLMADNPGPIVLSERADLRKHTLRGGILALLFGLVFAIGLHVQNFSGGVLVGGALAPDTATWTDLWRQASTGWLESGDGYAYPIDALWALLIPFLFLGHPLGLTLGQLLTVMVYAAIPLATVFAYLVAGRFSKSWIVRLISAGMWAVGPPFLEALAGGWVAPAYVHVLLPLAVYALVGAWRGSGTMMGLAALVWVYLSAAGPLFLPVGVGVALIGFFVRKGQRFRWLWLPIPALAALLPHLTGLFESPRTWLASPGAPAAAPANPAHLPLISSLEFSAEPNLQWMVFAPLAVFLLTAVIAFFRSDRKWLIRVSWVILLTGFGLAYLATQTRVAVGDEPFTAWPIGLSILWLGLFLAMVNGAYALRTRARKYNFGLPQIITGLLLLAVPMSVLSMAGYAVYEARGHKPGSAIELPATGSTAIAGAEAQRVLVLHPGNNIRAEIWRNEGIAQHEYTLLRSRDHILATAATVPEPDPARESLAAGVANLVVGARGAAADLGKHAIGVVVITPEDTPGRADLVAKLNAAPGLEFITDGPTGTVWRNAEPAGRIQLAEETVTTTIEPASQPRELHLAERADQGWSASVGGVELELSRPADGAETDEGWAQQWIVPAGLGGELQVTHQAYPKWAVGGVVAVLAIAAIMALPLRPRRGIVQ